MKISKWIGGIVAAMICATIFTLVIWVGFSAIYYLLLSTSLSLNMIFIIIWMILCVVFGCLVPRSSDKEGYNE